MFAQATQQPALLNESRELKEETTKLEKLLTELSDVPEAFSLYAQILSEQEKYEKAEEYYRMALEKDANNGALIVQRALNIMTWKNEFDEAVKMLNQAIEIDNTCEFAYETLATIEIQRYRSRIFNKNSLLLWFRKREFVFLELINVILCLLRIENS